MMTEAGYKYGPAMGVAMIGAVDPRIAAIAFGMLAGWLALAAVLYDEGRPMTEIRRKLIVSVGVGSVGALLAGLAVRSSSADPLVAAIIAAAIAFGGVRVVKRVLSMAGRVVLWAAEHALSDAVGARRRREADEAKVDALLADRSIYQIDQTRPPDAVLPPGTDDKTND